MTMQGSTKTYTIERLSPNNLSDVAALYAVVFGNLQAPDFFLKKYDTGYTGVKYVGFIAYNMRREPMSYYGVIPTLLWYEGQVILAAQSADTMTHEKYRNMGLFTELAESTFNLCRVEGIRLVFGFPNQNSFHGLVNNLKWHVTEMMARFMIPVKSIPLEKLAHKYPILKPAYNGYKNWVLKKYLTPQSGVANSVLADNYNGVFRDDNYLRYKTYSSTQVIQIGSSTIWIKLRNGLLIGDIANAGEDFDHTMQKLHGLARKLGVKEIQFHISPDTELHTLFAQRYQPITSFPVSFKTLDEHILTDKIKFTFADIDIF